MPQVDKDEAAAFLKEVKKDVRDLIEKHNNRACELAINSTDPHTPVIGCLQMALAAASLEYLMACGVRPQDSFQQTVDMTAKSMGAWLEAITKQPRKQ